MAVLFPTLEQIQNFKMQPKEGELQLLHSLNNYLDNSYEIYFKPFLNGDTPDIVILRKNSGVLIIGVKEWSLDNYELKCNNEWHTKSDFRRILSPIEQVQAYRKNLCNLHCIELFNKQTHHRKILATINCAVYFHCATEKDLSAFYGKDISQELINYVKILGKDSIEEDKIRSYFSDIWLSKKSYYFDLELYYNIQRFVKPPFHQMEEGQPLRYTNAQSLLIPSVEGQRRKIKGVAGSGKTYILAQRAVNAHKRTNDRVLILTYNLALKNYIHDRINDVRENFEWSNFYITNYHQFFKTQATNYHLNIQSLSDFDNGLFFESVKDFIKPYKAIFIDEIQDYQQGWLDNIINYFANEKTELIVFGDEKQNIYDRTLDDNKEIIVRTIAGQWNRSLNKSFRLIGAIANLAMLFQSKILSNKYQLDELTTSSTNNSLTLNIDQHILKYYYCHSLNPTEITDQIFRVIQGEQIHSSDIAILSTSIDMIRNINDIITDKYKEKTTITFETNKEYQQYQHNISKIHEIRRNRKNNLWFKTGTIKLSTIHSFKGWEMHTVFLLLENDGQHSVNPELVYTGITRARFNLIIFNLDNLEYHRFFDENIIDSEELKSNDPIKKQDQ